MFMKKMKKLSVLGLVAVLIAVTVVSVTQTKKNVNASAKKAKSYNITLYKGNANASGFETKKVTIKNLTAYSIIKELKAYGAVASNVKANSLNFKGKYLVLDLSKEFAQDVQKSGTSGEYVKVGSVVNTFIDAFKVDTLTITVEGKSWESGHKVYDGPLSRFN